MPRVHKRDGQPDPKVGLGWVWHLWPDHPGRVAGSSETSDFEEYTRLSIHCNQSTRSKRSRFITLFQAATKSRTNFSPPSSEA